MRVSEIIESQHRAKERQNIADLKEKVEANQALWDEIGEAFKHSKLRGDSDVEFEGTYDCSFSEGEFFWAHVDGHLTQNGNKWQTNFVSSPEVRSDIAQLIKGDRFKAVSRKYKILSITKL